MSTWLVVQRRRFGIAVPVGSWLFTSSGKDKLVGRFQKDCEHLEI